MRILFVMLFSVEDLNSAVLRNLALLKGMVSLGYECTLICMDSYAGIILSDISKYDFLEKIEIIKLKQGNIREKVWSDPTKRTLKAKLVNVVRKVYHSLFVLGSSKRIAKDIDIHLLNGNTDYDVVISSSDPKTAHLAIKALTKQGLTYKKWIEYWGDPLTTDMTNSYIVPKSVLKRIEISLIKNADIVYYVSPFTLEQQKLLFKKYSDKMSFIPIPYIAPKSYPEPHNEKYTISYVGAYSSKVRDIIPLYEALKKLNKKTVSYIVGDSDITLEETDNIHIMPRGDASAIESKSDLLVCVLNKKGTQIPGKLYHVAATNKPILVVLDGDKTEEMKRYIDGYDRFITCSNTIESICDAITHIMETRIEWKPCECFSPETIAKRILSE